MLACNFPQLYSYSWSIYTPAVNEQLVELPAILELPQYHKHSYRGGGWRVEGCRVGSGGKWQANPPCK